MKKLAFVITARPSLARIQTAIQHAAQHEDCVVEVIVAASMLSSFYGEAEDDLAALGLTANWRIPCLHEAGSPGNSVRTAASLQLQLVNILEHIQPDCVITIADRYETIATAIASSYMNIPLVHIQGGEVSGNIDEKVRHAITKLADLHLVANEDARQRVIRMGEHPDSVIVTGCPSIDVARAAKEQDEAAQSIDFKWIGHAPDLTQPYVIVLQHPVTTHFERARSELNATLEAMHKLPERQILWFWPNPDAGTDGASKAIRTYREHHSLSNIAFIKHVPSSTFLRLLLRAGALVGNSSVGIRESAYLGVPVVNIGDRQQGRLRGANVLDVPEDAQGIFEATCQQMEHGHYPSEAVYGNGEAGKRIVDAILETPLHYSKQIEY